MFCQADRCLSNYAYSHARNTLIPWSINCHPNRVHQLVRTDNSSPYSRFSRTLLLSDPPSRDVPIVPINSASPRHAAPDTPPPGRRDAASPSPHVNPPARMPQPQPLEAPHSPPRCLPPCHDCADDPGRRGNAADIANGVSGFRPGHDMWRGAAADRGISYFCWLRPPSVFFMLGGTSFVWPPVIAAPCPLSTISYHHLTCAPSLIPRVVRDWRVQDLVSDMHMLALNFYLFPTVHYSNPMRYSTNLH